MKVSNINCEPKYHYRYYPCFQAQRTFAMLKPDAFDRRLVDKIMKAFKEAGLTIVKFVEGIQKREKFEQLYQQYKNKDFFEARMEYLTSGKVRALIIEGDDAVAKALKVKKEIRSEFAPNDIMHNLIHSSDTVDDAKRESGIFFEVVA